MLKMNGEQRSAAGEPGILKGKGRGRFRPNEKVGGVIRRREAELLDFVEIASVSLKPVPRIDRRLREIRLDGAGVMIGGGPRDDTRADGHDGENENSASGEDHGANFGRRRGSQNRPGKERVEGGDCEGEAPDSGDRGGLEEREISGGGIAGDPTMRMSQ